MSNTNAPIGRIMLRNVRLAFPNLFEATTVNGEGDPRFGATFILPPDHPQLADLRKIIDKVAAEKWKDKAGAQVKAMEKTGKLCLRDGDEKPNYDGFSGNFFVAASAKDPPPTEVPARAGACSRSAPSALSTG